MSTPHVLEVALFTVKPEARSRMPHLREQLRAALAHFPGLIDYQGYEPMPGEHQFADIARWEDLPSAEAAAAAFASGDARFLPYMQAIDTLQVMRHYQVR